MLASMRVVNPRYAGAPARMADGRLFTDYRPNCSLIGPPSNATLEMKQQMQENGLLLMGTDRSLTVMRAGSTDCVDTMVPELSKRICGWKGCATLPAQPVGIGQGRLYLPGRPDLAAADPDVVARATFPMLLPGTFSPNPNVYVASSVQPSWLSTANVVPARPNRYSVPYGN